MITKRPIYHWVFHGNMRLQVILVVVVCVTVAARVFPLEMQKLIINEAIGLRKLDSLYLYCGLYIGSVTLAGLLKLLIRYLQVRIGTNALKALRSELFQHVLSLPLPFFRRASPGLVVSSLTAELEPMIRFAGEAISNPLVNVLTFVAFTVYMFHLNPLLAAISVVVYPIEAIVLPLLQKRQNKVNRERSTILRQLSGLITESITGVHEVHGNASHHLEGERVGNAINKHIRLTRSMENLKSLIKFVNNQFLSFGPFTLFLVGGYLAIHGRFDLGALVAFLSAYEKLYDPWRELMTFYQQYQDSAVRYSQVMDFFDQKPEHPLEPEERSPIALTGEIAVQDVSYTVSGNIRLLDHMSLSLKPGEHMALVGFSGSGKSTLAKAMAQLLKYSGGSVQFNGHEVADLTKRDMAESMGVVAQHPFIFDGSIYDNLLYSCDAVNIYCGTDYKDRRPDLDRVIEVIQQVGLFVDVLRFGLRTQLGREAPPELLKGLVSAREQFQQFHGQDLAHDIEFFEDDKFLQCGTIAENLVFGAPEKPEFAFDVLHSNPQFLVYLEEQKLREPLEQLGLELARKTVEIIRMAGSNEELFEKSPIPYEEFAKYASLVDRIPPEEINAVADNDRSTLLKLAMRFIPLAHPLVSIPAELLETIPASRTAFREFIKIHAEGSFTFYCRQSYLPSQPLLDNITYGHIRPDSAGAEERVNQRIMQLLIMENILETVVEIGLQFEVGSMGDRLSGGQRQKVALARAFLKDPKILVLDEATSALDNASQARIQNLLERRWKGKATVLSVVHRLDTLKGYDKIAVLKAGKIVEQGPYDELMSRKGALYELVNGAN